MWWKKLLAIKVSLVVAVLAVLLVNATDRIHERSLEVKYLKQQVELHKKFETRMMGMECKDLRSVKVTVTSFNPVKRQTDNEPLIGASGELVTPGIVAISRDLTKKYNIKLGDKVVIEGMGVFTVSDYTAHRFKKRVDVLSLIPDFSKEFGIKRGINLYFNKN